MKNVNDQFGKDMRLRLFLETEEERAAAQRLGISFEDRQNLTKKDADALYDKIEANLKETPPEGE